MSSSKLNILTVGTRPNLVYYSHKFQQTGKFNVFYINEDLNTSEPITLRDFALNSNFTLRPKISTTSFTDFNPSLRSSNIKFDIVFLSSNSLQELSDLASNLTPFLNKSSILIIESTGSVQLEPYLKSIPQFKDLHLAIFSIVSTLDIRRTSVANEYVNLTSLKTREVYIGEAQISPSKYGKGPQQNLSALSKLFSMDDKDHLRVTIRSTHQEYLTEQWKYAIPQICFNPLLILFEEPSPLKLKDQILAKPLLSGLVTELITVSKSMGCKLPVGFDNESDLLKAWVEPSAAIADIKCSVEHINSPKLFYDYFHSNPLNIDMILLQPILLADDFGIKTPYLEFLYATLCRLEKMNYASLFFIRRESINAQIKENQRISQELYEAREFIEELKNEREQSSVSLKDEIQQEKNKNTDLGAKLADNVKVLQNLQAQYQQQGTISETRKNELSRVQTELEQVKQQFYKLQQTHAQSQAQLQRRSTAPMKNSNSSVNLLQQTISSSVPAVEEPKHSETGTPDLRDLREAALFSSQLSSTPRASAVDQADISTSTVLQHDIVEQEPASAAAEIPNIGNDSSLSLKELELVKKEQMLAVRELEFNKKLQQLRLTQQPLPRSSSPPQQVNQVNQPLSLTQNTVFAQQPQPQVPLGLQPPLQPRLKHHSSAVQLNSMQNGNHPQKQVPGQFAPRRINPGMVMDAESYQFQQRQMAPQPPAQGVQQLHHINGSQVAVGFNQMGPSTTQFRKADRKNRKSSMPITSTANFQGGNVQGPLMMNGGQRRSTMTSQSMMFAGQHSSLMENGNAFSAGMNAGSMVANGNSYQQQQQFNNRIQAPQPLAMKKDSFHNSNNNSSRSNSGTNSSTEDNKFTTPPPQPQPAQLQPQPQPTQTAPPLEKPQTYKSNGGYATPASNSSDSNNEVQGEQEVKPLGAISTGNQETNYGTNNNGKKKFGLFGRKK